MVQPHLQLIELDHRKRKNDKVVGENINIMKTTFDVNFDFDQAFKQHGYTPKLKQREAVN